MTRDEAIAIAEAHRGEHHVPDTAHVSDVERLYIRVTADPGRPLPHREALVWSVCYSAVLGIVWLAVEDGTGEIVRVRRGR
jgi:hypothetical protein